MWWKHQSFSELDWLTCAVHLIISVGRSCYDTPAKTVSGRLGIELASMGEHLWRERGGALPDRMLLEEKFEVLGDLCRWFDTSAMVVACLTETVEEDCLLSVLATNEWCHREDGGAKTLKLRTQRQRRRFLPGEGSRRTSKICRHVHS